MGWGSDALDWAWNDGLDMASNFSSGFADVLTMGLTERYRDAMGFDSFVDEDSGVYLAGQATGVGTTIALGVLSPCHAGLAGTGVKMLNGVELVGNSLNLAENLREGDVLGVVLDTVGITFNVNQMRRACFAAGTPLLTPDGSKLVENIQVGDLLLSCPEDDAEGPIEPRRVEEVFLRSSPLVSLKIGGQVIRTTLEHPFYVKDKGWVKAHVLSPGDLLRTADNRWLPLESITDTGEFATVYNFRIEEYHTYFVGSRAWGFSVWSHNAKYAPKALMDGAETQLRLGTSKATLKLEKGVLKVSDIYIQRDSMLAFLDMIRQVGQKSGAKSIEVTAEFLSFPLRDRLMKIGVKFEKVGDVLTAVQDCGAGGVSRRSDFSAHRCAACENRDDDDKSHHFPQIRREAQECTLTWSFGPRSVAEC